MCWFNWCGGGVVRVDQTESAAIHIKSEKIFCLVKKMGHWLGLGYTTDCTYMIGVCMWDSALCKVSYKTLKEQGEGVAPH